jgi:serine/threonine protein phosphatase 1
MMPNIFAIGDIHGCLDKLELLMGKIESQWDAGQDILVFLGDYIDRGPNSFEVVEYLIQLEKRIPNTIFLKGNHEEMLEFYLAGVDRHTYLVNGGQQTLDDYLDKTDHFGMYPIPQSHLNFFSSLCLYYQTDDYIFVHAGLKKKVPLELQDSEDLLWIRDKFIQSNYDFGKRVIFGHTPFREPLVQPNKIGIDTGAVYGNKLTCVKLPQMEFFHV